LLGLAGVGLNIKGAHFLIIGQESRHANFTYFFDQLLFLSAQCKISQAFVCSVYHKGHYSVEKNVLMADSFLLSGDLLSQYLEFL
jgi:hypothetical protein